MDAGPISPTGWRPDRCFRVALVLQGGGALGAYQAGVYTALHDAGFRPDWVSGVSIGAINSAIIAGNPPERRIERLHTFWNRVTTPDLMPFAADGDDFRRARNARSALTTMLFGQRGFFQPNPINPFFAPRGGRYATAFYDTSPLRETLLELVDFNLLNRPDRCRFSVGAVDIRTGNLSFFDNRDMHIGPEHIMASGALPPALPAVKVGSDHYWDGGLVSNTPLQHLLDQDDLQNTLVFQVDLFPARGAMPRDMREVLGRMKDIRYSSRTRYNTDVYKRLHDWKVKLKQALEKVPEEALSDEQRALKAKLADLPEVMILHLIHEQKVYESHARDYEFSAESMRDHWQSGEEDTQRTLARREWLEMPPEDSGVITHDVHRV